MIRRTEIVNETGIVRIETKSVVIKIVIRTKNEKETGTKGVAKKRIAVGKENVVATDILRPNVKKVEKRTKNTDPNLEDSNLN